MRPIQFLATAAFVAVLALAATSLTGCTRSAQDDKTPQAGDAPTQESVKTVQYTCSMHPEVVQDKPGNCPKCGMKLVEKR